MRQSLRTLMNGKRSKAKIYQVLITSSDGEIFLFFNTTVNEKQELNLGLLNLDVLPFG